jgi:hypothetical protein
MTIEELTFFEVVGDHVARGVAHHAALPGVSTVSEGTSIASNVMIGLGLPPRTVKSLCVRPRMGTPFSSRTVASTRTRSTPDRNRGVCAATRNEADTNTAKATQDSSSHAPDIFFKTIPADCCTSPVFTSFTGSTVKQVGN